tara:strand:+ start:1544 stop:1744 length:201 start_codon:yes stop_codon:yes gene_type:complete
MSDNPMMGFTTLALREFLADAEREAEFLDKCDRLYGNSGAEMRAKGRFRLQIQVEQATEALSLKEG